MIKQIEHVSLIPCRHELEWNIGNVLGKFNRCFVARPKLIAHRVLENCFEGSTRRKVQLGSRNFVAEMKWKVREMGRLYAFKYFMLQMLLTKCFSLLNTKSFGYSFLVSRKEERFWVDFKRWIEFWKIYLKYFKNPSMKRNIHVTCTQNLCCFINLLLQTCSMFYLETSGVQSASDWFLLEKVFS